MKQIKLLIVIFLTVLHTQNAYSEQDAQSKADAAVANILFDYDYGNEFASYRVNEDGFVDILMARNTPDPVYGQILTRLQNHPDIDGVLASKTGPACKVSNW